MRCCEEEEKVEYEYEYLHTNPTNTCFILPLPAAIVQPFPIID